MPRTTKAKTAKAKHKKVLSSTKDITAQEVGFIRLQNNQILNPFNMLSEIERIKKEALSLYGSQESMLVQDL